MWKLNNKQIELVRLQRTQTLNISDTDVAAVYKRSCQKDFDSMQRMLMPPSSKVFNILDIGAGLGGVDVLLYHYYKEQNCRPHIFILDKDEVDTDIKYGYSIEASAYNNFKETKAFLQVNGVPPRDTTVLTALHDDLPKFDLVISLISCGFHYPITEYLSYILTHIHGRTRLVFDIRKYSKQFDLLHDTFSWVNCLFIAQKYKRMGCCL